MRRSTEDPVDERREERRHVPGGQGRLRIDGGVLQLELLDDEGRHLATRLEVDHATTHALHHLHALHQAAGGDDHEAPAVGLLATTLAALDARIDALVVEDGPPPRFRLTVVREGRRLEVPVDLVDAVGLIFSRRVRLELRAAAVDWDRALDRLLEDHR
ncbi:hypothetical protein FTX61_06250 [Nitriliruptoraceae bacterium ZYF776]|nr:hypothetical protein [Profundirhabdus halotolerans]